ncbi:MAG: ATPase, partial [Clostridia bacterium]|nr:ATPase [Clostridia bacterium]
MKMDMLIDELQEIVEGAFTLPLSGGKTVVNTDRIREIIDEMRINLPQEVRQAKNIAADRTNIIAKAKEEAEDIVQRAEERAKTMVSQNEIVRQAQKKADEIIFNANNESAKIK